MRALSETMIKPKTFSVWSCALLAAASTACAADNDVAVAIVYDTSGSMSDPVHGKTGGGEPKFQIANRALSSIVARLEKFNASGARKVQAGLFAFSNKGARAIVKPGPFDAAAMRAGIAALGNPKGATPLGTAIDEATAALAKVKASSRHLLIITDGENSVGPPPEAFLPKLINDAKKSGSSLHFHFVAFDVDASVFAAVKKLGVTLAAAGDETQLNEKLTYILEEKILLEKE